MASNLEQQDARDLAAYGMIILQLARRHEGSGWLLYDCQFRQHKAAGVSLPWADINPSLMAATVLGQANNGFGRCFPLCLLSDHSREDCALLSMEQAKPRPPSNYSSRFTRRPAPYQSVDPNICRRFNRSWCTSSSCRFEHICTGCSKPGHGEVHCPEARLKSKVRVSEARAAMSSFKPNSSPG